MRFLVEESESHVIILFLLGFLLLLLFLLSSGRSGSTGSGSSRCGSTTTSGWHGGKLGASFSDDFLDALAGEFSDDDLQGGGIGLNTDRTEDLLNAGGRDFSSAEGSQKCSSHVTHV